MKNIDYIRGSLGEINTQIIRMEKRKEALLEELAVHRNLYDVDGGKKQETNFDISKSPYARYLRFMNTKREPLESPKVVFQGEHGAYSEIACRKFFGKDVQTQGMHNFEDTFTALAQKKADYAVLPIENSSTGAIRQVYDLLELYNYFFVGETTVQIEHALLALPGTKLEDIKVVYSHEQGLFQCEKFLGEHPHIRPVPQADTAGSVRMVSELNNPSIAAIASPLAAEIYGLDVVKERINTIADNTTRFIVISPKPELRPERDKICISLTTGHISGALYDVLTVFAVHGVNLVRLESRPIPEHNWEYMFFIEFTGDLLDKKIDTVIHEIALLSTDLRVLGNFKANL